MKKYVDKDKLQEYSTKLTAKYKTIFATKNEVGSPLVASTVAEMTNTEKVYVYIGSESGYTSGNWYYYDGSAWVSGGIYNSTAFETDETLSVEGAAADAKAVGDVLNAKANTDGYYEEMSVGNAEQIISSVMVEDKEPYNFRTAGGSADIGNRLTEKIVGGSIVWNQIQASTASRTYNGITYTYSNGKVTIQGTATATSLWVGAQQAVTWNWYKDHVYLVDVGNNAYSGTSNKDWRIPILNETSDSIQINSPMQFVKPSTDLVAYLTFYITSGQTIDPAEEYFPQVFDLTQMFGSAIADYVYSLETATAGAGVAWFKKLFPKQYYSYNAGEIMSVKAASHDTVGFNALDPETGKAKLIGGNQYQITGIYTSLSIDGVTVTPSSGGYFTPSENGELTVTGGGDDTCVHLVWSGYRDGEYEEYKKRTYPLDTSLELRGIMKLDAANKLYYDGDVYESDGTVTRKYGVIDLGTIEWYKSTNPQRYEAATALPNCKPVSSYSIRANMISAEYETGYNNYSADKYIFMSTNGFLRIVDPARYATMNREQFQASLSGVYLVYELAEPTSETAEPFQSPQVVDDFGTEEYVDYGVQQGTRDVSIPVGHESQYPANLRDKLQRLPNLPSANGDYIVRYADRQAAFVPLEDKYPSPPSEDGTYKLVCTVANGTVTYSWEENV